MTAFIHVAVGVVRDGQGRVLLAKRPDHVHQGGLWEFPGGKVEPDESVLKALQRELQEELAIDPDLEHCEPLIQIRHHYPDKSVLLDVWMVPSYAGTPRGNEGQALAWVELDALQAGPSGPYPLPAANGPIIKALRLPHQLLITGDFSDPPHFQQALSAALKQGIRLVLLRPSAATDRLSATELASLVEVTRKTVSRAGAQLLLSEKLGIQPAAGEGLHLGAEGLMSCQERPLPLGQTLGASCHDQEQLRKAAQLDVDYVLLSPVKATTSHPQAKPMGWEAFADLLRTVNLPVYALGGMRPWDLSRARGYGAQGIAAISAFWKQAGR